MTTTNKSLAGEIASITGSLTTTFSAKVKSVLGTVAKVPVIRKIVSGTFRPPEDEQ